MARVTSIYKVLKYVVECQRPGTPFFEVIAAFNHDGVAIDYAKGCLAHQFRVFSSGALDTPSTPFGWRYRVTERKNNEPKCIYRSDANAAA